MLVFKRFHHVVLAVKDARAAAADWERVFAAKALPAQPGLSDGWTGFRFGVGDAWIDLAQPKDDEGPLAAFLETYGQGVYSVALQVDDVKALASRARQMGAHLLGDAAGPGPLFIAPKSATGVLLGLYPPGGRSTAPSLFKRFHHIVIATGDHQGAIAHWQRLFGTKPHPEGPDRQVAPNHIPVGDAWFGLTAEGTDAAAVTKFLERRGEGVYLVSVVVDDVRKTAKAVRERGGRIIGNEDQPGQVFVHPATTHGLLLELSDDTIRMWPDEA